MALMDIVKKLEKQKTHDRRKIIYKYLEQMGVSYELQDYGAGINIIVASGMEREIGVSSHYDVAMVDGIRSSGANDNASAIAVCLGVLKKFKEQKLENIGVRGIFFDEEEIGSWGSHAYVRFGGIKGLFGLYNTEMVGMGDKLVFWADHHLYEGILLKTIKEQVKARGIGTYDFPNLRNVFLNSGDHSRFNEAG